MTRSKKPRAEGRAPSYPTVRDGGIDRRRFIAMLGGGAAALAASCGSGDGDRIDRLPGEEPRLRPERLSGVVPLPDTSGEPPSTPLPERARALSKVIMPGAVDALDDPLSLTPKPAPRVTLLGDGTEVGYLLYFSVETPADKAALLGMSEPLLTAADAAVRANRDHVSIASLQGLSSLREILRQVSDSLLAPRCAARFLEVEITRVRRRDIVKGRQRIAEPPEDPVIRRTAGIPPRPPTPVGPVNPWSDGE
jgi:hypothetical protein